MKAENKIRKLFDYKKTIPTLAEIKKENIDLELININKSPLGLIPGEVYIEESAESSPRILVYKNYSNGFHSFKSIDGGHSFHPYDELTTEKKLNLRYILATDEKINQLREIQSSTIEFEPEQSEMITGLHFDSQLKEVHFKNILGDNELTLSFDEAKLLAEIIKKNIAS